MDDDDTLPVGNKPTTGHRPRLIALDNLATFEYSEFRQHLQMVEVSHQNPSNCDVGEDMRRSIYCGRLEDNESTVGDSGMFIYSCRVTSICL